MTEREIDVHVDLDGVAVRAGRLCMRVLRGRESASFVYDTAWLTHPLRFALDPVHLPLSKGQFAAPAGRPLFGGISDSAPDRWGRTLMARKTRLAGERRTLFEADYLLMVDDTARQGALRFTIDGTGPFLASGQPHIPPLVRLGELLFASDRVQDDEGDADALRLLLAPGSSLGGARPKASVLGNDGALSIAKFPARSDEWPVIVWEAVASQLARAAGVDVQQTQRVEVQGRAVLVGRRFDRRGERRIPFLSAMAMIGATDGEDEHSYLEIADAIRQHGAHVDRDLAELWRRMTFNVLISNTDDHLRNHGFLRAPDGWRLSPAYDLNPVPIDVKARVHALALDEQSPVASVDTLLAVVDYFGLTHARARGILGEAAAAVSDWRRVAGSLGLTAAQLDRMASAFEHADLEAARRLGTTG